jgi:ribosome-associated protein
MKVIQIKDGYITLGQFLKLADCIGTGGAAKPFLADNKIVVNGVKEDRRGRKLLPGDKIEVTGCGSFVLGIKS